jgi:hypothetical protein
MGEARFVFVSDGVDDSGGLDVHRVWWRLVAANNRVLGRSTATVLGEGVCRDRAAELATRIEEAVPLLTTDAHGQWTWTLSLDGGRRAECAHPFPRRVDCVRTLALFLAGIRAADPHVGALRVFAVGRYLPREPIEELFDPAVSLAPSSLSVAP